jgi:multimeric flavodoxin WrbA
VGGRFLPTHVFFEGDTMSKKILVLTGSPRQGGNTDILADAFIEGAQRAGNQIFRFDAGRKNVAGCVACETCFSSGHPCSYVDDFEEYANYLRVADVLAIFSPVYWFSFPAQLKATIDKMYCFYNGEQPVGPKESFLVMVAGGPSSVFDAAIANYNMIADLLAMDNKGHIVVPNVHDAGAVNDTPAVDGMRRLGEAI